MNITVDETTEYVWAVTDFSSVMSNPLPSKQACDQWLAEQEEDGAPELMTVAEYRERATLDADEQIEGLTDALEQFVDDRPEKVALNAMVTDAQPDDGRPTRFVMHSAGIEEKTVWIDGENGVLALLRERGLPMDRLPQPNGHRNGVTWGAVPPAEILMALPTPEVMQAWPYFYAAGPGYAVARLVFCGHGYRLTDTCPGCDAAQEAAQDLELASPRGQALATVTALITNSAGSERSGLIETAFEMAHHTAVVELQAAEDAFASTGAKIFAIRKHARRLVTHEVGVQVHAAGLDHGASTGDWDGALQAARGEAILILRESVLLGTDPIVKAIAALRASAADDLLRVLDSFEKAAALNIERNGGTGGH